MDRRRFVRHATLAGTIALAGCASGDDGTTPPATLTTPPPTLADDEVVELSGPPCEAIAGATFKSIDQREVGEGPGGSAPLGHWTVSFERGEYDYVHSDVVESGSYTWEIDEEVARVEGTPPGRDVSFSGTYDPGSGVLEWDSVRFRPIEGN